MNVEEAWARIRMTRATPPAAATFDDNRLDTYVTALEQAQQMFAAAIASGVTARPLLIFYGLSQAGRPGGRGGVTAAPRRRLSPRGPRDQGRQSGR